MKSRLAIILVLGMYLLLHAQQEIYTSNVLFKAKSFGVPAWPYPLEYTQPDGSIVTYFIRGDGAVHWQESAEGYPIVKNKAGFFTYAKINSKEALVPSSILVSRNRGARTASERRLLNRMKKGVPFSSAKIARLRDNYLPATRGPAASKAFPPTGTGNLLVLLIKYPDAANTYSQTQFNNQMNQDNYNGTGSFKQYYYECSYGQLTVNSTVSGWHTASQNHDYYGDNVDPTFNRARSLVREAIDQAETAGINFASYDNDSDGEVDGIMVIHQGLGAEMGDNTCIWSHSSQLGSYAVTYDGVLISDYTINPETRPGGAMAGIGTPCHEFGHNLGLKDLYDTDYGGSGGESQALGSWDVMASGNYNNNGNSPAHHNAWSKEQLGWLTITEINSPALISMTNVEQNQVAYKFYTPTPDEYFLLENRQNSGFDAYLPGHGLLIYHVDGSYIASAGNSINCDPSHQGFDMEEADNTESHSGGDAFPGTTGAYSFTDVSTPNSRSWAGANTNKTIINIQEISGVISFNFMMGDPVITNVDHSPSTPTSLETVQVTARIVDNGSISSATLKWCTDGTSFNNSVPMSVVSGDNYQSNTDIPSQSATTTVTYQIVAVDNESNSTTSSNYAYTVVAPTYCAATSDSCDEYISRVQVGSIDNSTDCQEYQDFTSLSTDMEIGISYPITVTNGPPSYTEDKCGIWVDWNRNFSFYDAGETIAVTGNPGGGPYTATITPPSDAELGATRLRIRIQYSAADTPDPCGTRPFGEVEDYTINVVPSLPPVADFTADNTTICQGESVIFTDNSTNNPTSWSWSITGPATFLSSDQNPSFTFITAGIYDVSLTALKSVGSDNETKTGYITVSAMATANAGANATICEGDTYTLSGSVGGGASSGSWSTSGSGNFDNAALLSATYTPSSADITAGGVTLTLTTNDPSGPCGAVSDNMVLTINGAATVNAGSDATICENDTYTLSGSIGGGATSGTWTTSGSGNFDNSESLTATYTPSSADITAGSVTLTLTTNDPSGPCDAESGDIVLTIDEAATANAGSDTVITEGESYTLTGAIGGSASTATWSTSGSGTFDNAGSLTATYTPSSADITASSVTLTLTTNDPAGPCDPVSDNMVLLITQIPTYTLTTPATNGRVSRNPDQTIYTQGSTIELTALPDTGYHFTGWTGDVTSSDNPLTIANITANMTVTANFAINEYAIVVHAGSGGTITPGGPLMVYYGQDTKFTITPDSNYTIVDVLVNDISQGAITSFQFTNVTSDQSITATFDIATDIYINNQTGMFKGTNFFIVPNPAASSGNGVSFYYAGAFKTGIRLHIYDQIGNSVYKNDAFVGNRSNTPYQLGFWNLRNKHGKKVYGGTYLAVFTYKNGEGVIQRERIILGVKVD